MLRFLQTLDRRWIFLLMLLAVGVPIVLQLRFPESITPNTLAAFAEIEKLEPGSRVLLSFDFDPASAGEIAPMATSFTYHAAKRGARLYFMALLPVGPQMAEDTIAKVIARDFPEMRYGVDFVNLGYKSGLEAVIKVIATDLRQMFTTDARGAGIESIPMMAGVRSVQDMDLVVSVSAGYPGVKEWVQYAKTPFPDRISMIAGVTGVQAPPLLPYVPVQLPGLVAAIKGAAEYEALLADAYGLQAEPRYQEGRRRMGSQLVGHVLMILLIITGNVVYFLTRRQERQREARR
ncbi:MAG TPA: hypothetical protein PKC43_13930 [Phycisphaerales bacterium]|mgnify:CR=1 FL=1|nr:hypothetical protein [Phycisphaerales bacterium]HMP38533.1 hypothetical protein [Phycisphaerales bacterium]